MGQQAVKIQQLIKNKPRRAKVLAVTSGKGGVGKTNISTNLAICLASTQKKVLLVDADFSLGNVDVVMNITSKYNIWHMLSGRKRLEEIIHIGPADVSVISGASGIEDLANMSKFHRERLLSELERLQDDNDTIIVDTAAGISKSVVAFCLAADQTLVVTTPEATAMTDAYAMIKVLVSHHYKGQISLIVNMAGSQAEGKKVYHQMASVAKRFLDVTIYDAGVLLRDEQLLSAIRQRKPVVLAYPKSDISASIMSLASKLGTSSARQQSDKGFFYKIVDWFF
jgi:flagellar biosynthesis protein FlhG